MELNPLQLEAFDAFTSKVVKYLGYGGGAGGGKTVLGCYLNFVLHSELVGSKSFIGRDSLKDTRESVLKTFKKVAHMIDFHDWKYMDNHIFFNNGSEIEFLDLSYMPNKDPMYERFGSKEYTWGWIEEAGPVNPLAFDVLKSRVGRWYNEEFGLPGKILVTFNPRKNWVDTTFYRPWKNGKEELDTKFIRALAKDNKELPADYMDNLRAIKDKSTRERLLNGNFDYDDDPASLITYENIHNIFTNFQSKSNNRLKYLTADVARFGSDKAIILVWEGFKIIDYQVFPISSTTMIQRCINAMRIKHGIPASRCIADEDGIGGGVVDNCGVLGFSNGGKPSDPAYLNLKSQCGYKLADMVTLIHFEADLNDEVMDSIEEELGQLKTYDADKDGKLRILPKEKIKANIGRSPDWLDNFIMRMFFEIFDLSAVVRAKSVAQRALN